MPEAVRLVVWDLDDTFWRGTVTEGGIQEYVAAHHDIVIELARRGILSSICSKNDEATILPILEAHGILPYFIFPSIAWEPKGVRLARLIEAVQLRPATVMFIDDNPSNRGEAASMIPDLQVEDETFIPRLLADPRFKGKDDSKLTRLAQYKLLEQRKRDEASASGGNEAFLRGCDIRVRIEYDVEQHADRAIELINRTNQLNFTKRRLPEDAADARAIFLRDIAVYGRHSGLIHVADRYGDYGFVGFYLTKPGRRAHVAGAADTSLVHYCFSCRTLGMLIEQWVYNHLGRPELDVAGEVLTDLSVPREIDWVTLSETMAQAARPVRHVAPAITLYGGCEAQSIALYMNAYSPQVTVFGNYSASGLFMRINSARIALSTAQRTPEEFAEEARILGWPLDYGAHDFFAGAEPGSVFAFNCARDAQGHDYYRHKRHGWTIALHPIGGERLNPLTSYEPEALEQIITAMRHLSADDKAHCLRVADHLRQNYDTLPSRPRDYHGAEMRQLLDRVPPGCKFVICLDHDRFRDGSGEVKQAGLVTQYNALMRQIAGAYPYVGVAAMGDAVQSDDELFMGGNHVHRKVYLRFAEILAATIDALPGRDTALAAAAE